MISATDFSIGTLFDRSFTERKENRFFFLRSIIFNITYLPAVKSYQSSFGGSLAQDDFVLKYNKKGNRFPGFPFKKSIHCHSAYSEESRFLFKIRSEISHSFLRDIVRNDMTIIFASAILRSLLSLPSHPVLLLKHISQQYFHSYRQGIS